MSTMIMSKGRSLGGFLAVALILTVTLVVLGHSADWSALPQVLAEAKAGYLAAGALCMAAFFTAQAVGSRTLLRALGYDVSLGQALRYALLDFYFSAITPCASGGQPAQLYYMQRDGIALGSASLAILLFNMTYHAASVLIAGTAWLYCGPQVVAQIGPMGWLLLYGLIVHLLLVALFATAILKPAWLDAAGRVVIALGSRLRLIKNQAGAQRFLQEQLGHYQQGAAYIRGHLGLLLKVQLCSILHLLALFSVPFFVYCAQMCIRDRYYARRLGYQVLYWSVMAQDLSLIHI